MIFKKLFLLISLVVTLNAQANFEIEEQSGSFITFNSAQATKAWIGLYKKGTSNEWSNVLAWSWVTNAQTKISNISHFHEGDYQARLFFNNSYTTEASIDFHIGQSPGNQEAQLVNARTAPYQKTFQLSIKPANHAKVNDWVGIFKKGLSHTRQNLVAWSYVKKYDRRLTMIALSSKGLSLGLYDIVYFTANSYQEDGPTAILTVEAGVCHGGFRGTYGGKSVLSIGQYNSFKQSNDWVAIFKKDAEPIRSNILHWSYVRDGEIMRESEYHTVVHFPTFPDQMAYNNFKIVLFENDTYTILGSSILNLCDD